MLTIINEKEKPASNRTVFLLVTDGQVEQILRCKYYNYLEHLADTDNYYIEDSDKEKHLDECPVTGDWFYRPGWYESTAWDNSEEEIIKPLQSIYTPLAWVGEKYLINYVFKDFFD